MPNVWLMYDEIIIVNASKTTYVIKLARHQTILDSYDAYSNQNIVIVRISCLLALPSTVLLLWKLKLVVLDILIVLNGIESTWVFGSIGHEKRQ